MPDTQWPRFQVFLQEKEGEPHQDVGSVHAPDPEMALLNARDVFVRRPNCVSLWVVPAEAICTRTAEELSSGGAGEQGGRGEERNLGELGGKAGAWGSGDKQHRSGIVEKNENPHAMGEADSETYYVFCKAKSASTQKMIGEVLASSTIEAVIRAVDRYPGQPPPFAWWVFPARLVYKTAPEDIESMFTPALDKPFRLSSDFHTVSMMREIKEKPGD